MRTLALSAAFACAFASHALAWGQEGHSIVAEIAQRRLSPEAARMVERLLGRGHSLASVASWADDVRVTRPETSNWHFVDIPLAAPKYDAARDCKNDPKDGFCIVAELDRLRHDLRYAAGNDQVEALKFAVHFVGDIHQPLHTVLEDKGGNDIAVDLLMRGFTCGQTREPSEIATNFHAAWDFGLIEKIVWDLCRPARGPLAQKRRGDAAGHRWRLADRVGRGDPRSRPDRVEYSPRRRPVGGPLSSRRPADPRPAARRRRPAPGQVLERRL